MSRTLILVVDGMKARSLQEAETIEHEPVPPPLPLAWHLARYAAVNTLAGIALFELTMLSAAMLLELVAGRGS